MKKMRKALLALLLSITVAGTSMGAIVGSLYAMGYSPDDMERLLKVKIEKKK